jgi:Tol biopolymer transport system component
LFGRLTNSRIELLQRGRALRVVALSRKMTGVLFGAALALLALAMPAHAAFPGANGKIAFTRSGPNNPGEIYTMNADGTGVTNITNDPAGDIYPAWSPDGSKIAFSSGRSGHYEIYTMNPDGTNVFQVTSGPGGVDNGEPAWSPDGSKLVFTSGAGFGAALKIINADGTGSAAGLPEGRSGDPNWSPDGSTIAFETSIAGPDQIATIKPDGTGLVRVTDGGADNFDPNWSPDGTQLAFGSTRDQFRGEIYTMNADGTGVTRLTTNAAQEEAPAFSPDGHRIVFVSGRDDPNLNNCFFCLRHIYVMNADGSGQTRLTDTPDFDQTPSWQPLVGPQRDNYKNAAQFCKAERDFFGDSGFRQKYGGGANAYGKCVSGG